MIELLLACANAPDTGKPHDQDTGFVEARETKEWTDAAVSEFLVGLQPPSEYQPVAWDADIGGALTGAGAPTIVAWGAWYGSEWSGSFVGVYPADGSGEQSMADSAESLLLVDSPLEGAALVSVAGADSDVTGDGLVDLTMMTLEDHVVHVYSGPLPGEIPVDSSVARVQLESPVFQLWSGVADVDGDGVGDLIAEDRAGPFGRIVTWLGPLEGDRVVDDADGALEVEDRTVGGVLRNDQLVLTDYEAAWLVPTTSLLKDGSVAEHATAYFDLTSTALIGAVELDAPDDDATSRVWVGVPRASVGEFDEAGAVFAFEDPEGVNEASDAVGTAWGFATCLGLGASLRHADNYADGRQGVWMGALGDERQDSGCDYSSYYGLWGSASPLRGQAWVNQLDDALVNLEIYGEVATVKLVPWGIAVGDLDGSGREDLVIANQEDVAVVRW